MSTISPFEKITIIGINGWGKSFLALSFLNRVPSLIIVDPKHEITIKDVPITSNPKDMLVYPRIIYRPTGAQDPIEAGDQAGGCALLRGDTCLYLDEAAILAPGQRIGRNLRAAIILGRSKNVGVWAATQRPKDVHNLFFSEAYAYFVAPYLITDDARKVMGFVRGYEEFHAKDWPKHTFWFYRKGEKEGKVFRVGAKTGTRR
ncbi:ATP-binding protein [Sulfobacillus thermosulfidooxidans]|uniref:ATP-binding protein n=1 Tax=Sulfobacillus thermosulfidooxidans TaxID=28034 RepID=UPI000364A99A|nr:ATP-binding protein [Sulfobacillus thermosulfidooxidans]